MATVSPVLVGARDHVVLFHESEDELHRTVGRHLAAALQSGTAVIVVASASHRAGFAEAMAADGVDVSLARTAGDLFELDSADTLAQFMADSVPDPAAFEAVIGDAVRRAAGRGRQVRIYGEMVADLWRLGHVAAALQVEVLWNELAEQLPFSLLCAYPSGLMAGDEHADAFAEVCQLHGAVVDPSAPGRDDSAHEHFPATRVAPRDARRFVGRVLQGWGRLDLVDDAALVVAELATNAVLHAQSAFEVTLTRFDGVVRIAVQDASSIVPEVRQADPTATSGRGMFLVAALATRWGCDPTPDGKRVWAELAGAGDR